MSPLQEIIKSGALKETGFGAPIELDYAQITANTAAISATTEATAVPVVTGNSVVYDGSRVKLEFCAASILGPGSNVTTGVFLRDNIVLGQFILANPPTGGSQSALSTFLFDTPPAGVHIYKVAVFVSAGSITIRASSGGSGATIPTYLRVTKDPPVVTQYVPVPGASAQEWDYAQITADTALVTATTEAAAAILINGNSVVYDGSRVKIDFFANAANGAGSPNYLYIVVFRDGVAIGMITNIQSPGSQPNVGVHTMFDTPPAGAHTYSIRGYIGSGTNAQLRAGAGGVGARVPAFLRVTRA